MPVPGKWIILMCGHELGRGDLRDCIELGVERGAIEVEIRFAAKTGDPVEKHILHRGVVILPAQMVDRARRVA